MSLLDSWHHIARSFVQRRLADDETREELAYHIARQTEKHIAAGATPHEARRLALIELGGVDRWREETAGARRGSMVFDMIADVRYALRGLAARPGFATTSLLTLAIGIGASTTVFTLAHGALLRPLPFRDADRIVSLSLRMPMQSSGGVVDMVWSYPKFTLFQERQHTLSSLALHSPETVAIVTGDGTERVSSEMASASYFSLLGARPVLGRTYNVDEDRIGGPNHVVVLSDNMWRTRFGARADILGQPLTIAGVQHDIIGVMPPGFAGLSGDAQFWIPVPSARSASVLQSAGAHNMQLVGRVRDGISVAAARSDVESVGAQLDTAFPEDNGHWSAVAYPLTELRINPAIRRSLALLTLAIGLVLTIVCVNLVILLLTRGTARRKELAVRIALGGSRARLMRQLVTETLVLVGLGSVLGIVLAGFTVSTLTSSLPRSMPKTTLGLDLTRVTFSAIRLDTTAVAFAFALALLIGSCLGVVAAARVAGQRVLTALRQGSAAGFDDRARARVQVSLVIAQVALAVVFLVASGLTIESLRRALAVPLGYEPQGLVTAGVTLDPVRVQRDSAAVLWRDILNALRAIPGAQNVAVSTCAPLGKHCEGRSVAPLGRTTAVSAKFLQVSPEYFEALKTPLLRGRGFEPVDESRRGVMIVNSRAAKLIWGTDDPLTVPVADGDTRTAVVGVVGDARYEDIERAPEPMVFVPFHATRGVVFLRTTVPGDAMLPLVRAAIKRAWPGHAVSAVETMDFQIHAATVRNRLAAQVFTAFGISALLLAAIGVYGTLALSVAQRTREFAIRRALGATGRSLVGIVMSQAALMLITGGAVGGALAMIVNAGMATILYDVRPLESGVYAEGALLLLLAMGAAAAIPSARSLRADPREAMKAE